MPELPEVQVVINYLNSKVKNQKVLNLEIINDKVLKNSTEKQFYDFLKGETILYLERKGKYLIIHLTNHKIWLVHLRMEGKLFTTEKGAFFDRFHTMVNIELNDYDLRFNDTRRFGTFHILYEKELDTFPELTRVAIDPLNKDFGVDYLYKFTSKSKKHIKTLLLDQSIVSGIGNIYADEILYESEIHPLKIANTLTKEQLIPIVHWSRKILEESIKHNGTTIHSFLINGVDAGDYQNKLRIHNRNIKNCKKCQEGTSFFKVNGRGTFICEKCQKI